MWSMDGMISGIGKPRYSEKMYPSVVVIVVVVSVAVVVAACWW
jgi:hypothetical protein